MAQLLQVEIIDDTCAEDEAFKYFLPPDSDKHDILNAADTFHPGYYSLYMVLVDEEE